MNPAAHQKRRSARKSGWFSGLAAAAFVLFAIPAQAAPAGLTQIPAEFRADGVFLQVSLNGRQPVWMQLDLDAKASSLSPSLAHAAGFAPNDGSVTADVAVGGVVLPAVAFGNSVATDGRLGGDFLGDRVMIVKYREHQVWISQPITPPAPPSRIPVTLAAR